MRSYTEYRRAWTTASRRASSGDHESLANTDTRGSRTPSDEWTRVILSTRIAQARAVAIADKRLHRYITLSIKE